MNPFLRRRRERDESAVESALRRSLTSHAMDATDPLHSDEVERRLLAAVDRDAGPSSVASPARRSRARWRAWGPPLVAAAVVAAVVGIGVAVAEYHPDDDGNGHQTASAASAGPSAPSTAPAPRSSSPSTSRPTVERTGTSGLGDVRIRDLTFYGADSGIALASSQCTQSAGQCVALLRTTDGQRWTPFGGRFGFDVRGVSAGCPADKCVDHIRFANDHTGYVYGPHALFMTRDGGASWAAQGGGAAALESLGGNVLRVRPTSSGDCLPGCGYEVQTAGIGTDSWTTVELPGGTPHGDGVQLSRGGYAGEGAYLLVTQNPAGGAGSATSTLYRSSDDGASWTNAGEPCPNDGRGEVDSYQVAAGVEDGNVAVLCRARQDGPYRVAVSNDSGAHFTLGDGTIAAPDVADLGAVNDVGSLPTVLAGDPSNALAVAGRSVWVSTDGGGSWTPSADLTGSFASVGFESDKVGRAVTADGSQIWTTRNRGRDWHRSRP